MKMGSDQIIKCSECNKLYRKKVMLSGNTFNITAWTDGKVVAPMLPEFPVYMKCANCNNYLWISDMNRVDTVNTKNADKYNDVNGISFVDIDEIFFVLKSNIAENINRERFIRINLWHRFNDKKRFGLAKFLLENDRRLIGSLNRLIEILDDNEDAKIMKAEIYREQGSFKEASNLLNCNFDSKFDKALSTIRLLNDNKDMNIMRI